MANLIESILLWFAVGFVLQQRVGPWVLVALRLPERHWVRAVPGQPRPVCLRGKMGAVRAFALALFRCSFCCGFHAGWLTWLLAPVLPEWARMGLMAAAAYYAADSLLRAAEVKR